MSVPIYLFQNLPPGMFNQESDEPFRAAFPKWKKLGFGPIVNQVLGNGVLVPADDGVRLVVWPDGQEYPAGLKELESIKIDDELSVLWESGKPPLPEDLCNGNPLRLKCYPVRLGDGNFWDVPEIRDPDGHNLPTDLIRDRKTGELQTPLKREYQAIWDESEYWMNLFLEIIVGNSKTFSLDRALTFATQVMSLRYRFCDATQSAMRLLDSKNVQEIISVAIGWNAVLGRLREIAQDNVTPASQKKSQSSVNASGSCGPEESDLTTDRLAVSNG